MVAFVSDFFEFLSYAVDRLGFVLGNALNRIGGVAVEYLVGSAQNLSSQVFSSGFAVAPATEGA